MKNLRIPTAALLVAILGGGAFLTWWTLSRADREMRAELLQQTRVVAQAVDIAELKALSGTKSDLDSPVYARLKEQLDAIRRVSPLCRSLYLLGCKPNGRIFFFVDSEPPDSQFYSPPGRIHSGATETDIRVFATRSEAVTNSVTDQWGEWVSSLVPIIDPQTALYELATAEDAHSMVLKAVEFYRRNGRERLLKEMNDPRGQFCKGDLYAFAFDRNMTWLAQPVKPELIGQNGIDQKDWSGGKYYHREIQQVALSQGSGWVSYEWQNPVNGQLDHKTTFVKRADDLIVCAGAYKGTGEICAVLGMTVDARARKWTLARAALPPVLLTLALVAILLTGTALLARRFQFAGAPAHWTQHLEAAVTTAVGLVLTLFSAWMLDERETHNRHEAFVRMAESRTQAIAETLRNLPAIQLEGLARFCESRVTVTPKEFHQFTGYLIENPAVEAWGWTEWLPAAEKPRFEEAARAAGVKNFEIWQKDPQGNRVPATGRDSYFPTVCVASPTNNERTVGYDGGSEPLRLAALEEAMRTGLQTSTLPLTLIHETVETKGMLIYRPVFADSKRLRGFAFAVLKMGTLLKIAGSDQSALMELSLLRQDAAPELLGAAWDTGSSRTSRLLMTRPIFAFGKVFLVTVYAGPEFMGVHPVRGGWLAALTGLLLTVASTTVMSAILRRHEKLEGLVFERTAALRKSEARFEQLAERSGTITWEVDTQGLITYASHVVEPILGYRPNELIEKKYIYDLFTDADRDAFKAGLFAVFEEKRSFQKLEVAMLAKDGRCVWVFVNGIPLLKPDGTLRGYQGSTIDITERKRAEVRLRLQSGALEAAANAIVITTSKGVIEWANTAFTTFTGYSVAEVIGKTPSQLKSGKHEQAFYHGLWETILAGKVWHGEMTNRRKDGNLYTEEMTITPIKDSFGEVTHFIAVKQDITARKRAEEEREQFEIQLRHAQKMESIGNLAAGIAHEINTPIQFVLNNVVFIRDAFLSLEDHRQCYQKLFGHFQAGTLSQADAADIADPDKIAKVTYLAAEVPLAIQQSLEGIDRVDKIVRAMKDFSHPGSVKPMPTDLNQAIASALTVCRSEWKRVAELVTCFAPDLPLVPCFSSEINQVVLNLVVNASHAITEAIGRGDSKGTITVATRHEGDWAEVRISDTGTGIPEQVRANVFDPFFTTKAVGKGTGLGLAIAHSIIVIKHGGTIGFETETDRGTTFIFRLPLNGPTIPL